ARRESKLAEDVQARDVSGCSGTVLSHGWRRRAYRDVFTACPGTAGHIPGPHQQSKCACTQAAVDSECSVTVCRQRGQASSTALSSVASGMAKKIPQKPHMPPNTRMATMIATGCRFTASENRIGTRMLPSINWMIA